MSRMFVFLSGKGGVGKSTLAANLSVLMARAGHSTALVDTDLGLRCQDLLLGLESNIVYDLLDAARGKCALSQALVEMPDLPALHLLPANQFARCRDLDPAKLRKILKQLRDTHEFVFIDCPAGLEKGLRNVLNAGIDLQPILVVTPDDLSLRDGERALALLEQKRLPQSRLIVNRLQADLISAGEQYSAATVAALLDLPLLGEVPEDPAVYRAQLRGKLASDFQCPAGSALARIAGRLLGNETPLPAIGSKKPALMRRIFQQKMKELNRRS